jgi:phage shock protein E
MTSIIVDVREPVEFDSGHVEGAINIPSSELISGAKLLQDTPKDTEIILYCQSGNRSNVAKEFLSGIGFTNLVNGINKQYVEAKYV